jgi:hypothetical protein
MIRRSILSIFQVDRAYIKWIVVEGKSPASVVSVLSSVSISKRLVSKDLEMQKKQKKQKKKNEEKF